MNVAAEALSRSKIRKLVREFRKAIGCEKMEYFPIVQFIEWILANHESGMDFEIVDPGEMQDTYGTTNTEKNVMRIQSDVYEGAVKEDRAIVLRCVMSWDIIFYINRNLCHMREVISRDIANWNGRQIHLLES